MTAKAAKHNEYWERALFPECGHGDRRERLLALASASAPAGKRDVHLARPLGRLRIPGRRRQKLDALRDDIAAGRRAAAEALLGSVPIAELAESIRAWAQSTQPYPTLGAVADRLGQDNSELARWQHTAELLRRAGVPADDRAALAERIDAETTIERVQEMARELAGSRSLASAAESIGLTAGHRGHLADATISPVPHAPEIPVRVQLPIHRPLPDQEDLADALAAKRDTAIAEATERVQRFCAGEIARVGARVAGRLSSDDVQAAARTAAARLAGRPAARAGAFAGRFRKELADALLDAHAEQLVAPSPDGWQLRREQSESLCAFSVIAGRPLTLEIGAQRRDLSMPVVVSVKATVMRQLLRGRIEPEREAFWRHVHAKVERELKAVQPAWAQAASALARLSARHGGEDDAIAAAQRALSALARATAEDWRGQALRGAAELEQSALGSGVSCVPAAAVDAEPEQSALESPDPAEVARRPSWRGRSLGVLRARLRRRAG